MQKILVATDASDYSRRALKSALELARKFNAEIELLYVMVDPVLYQYNDVNEFSQISYYENSFFSPEQIEHQGDLVLNAALEGADLSGVNLKKVKLHGHPASVILEEAEREHADLIVMGSHGYGAIIGSILGSVSQKVVHGAKCSVLIVK